ncbi:hypothetical protein L1080_004525 [Rhodococcus sp. MSC1_016]|jgi:hypothetical protein|uniref:hypothetical protein n=1 Tax=Rhodococcus sp. MSC1_016 TaxID=2909266 RepID=UPI00202F9FE0|nr:hypothetical protein [Rhodococcus sp. MSC1_016]
MSWDLEGNPVADGFCPTHAWAQLPCAECPTPPAQDVDGMYATCSVCTGEYIALGQTAAGPGTCPNCTTSYGFVGGLL